MYFLGMLGLQEPKGVPKKEKNCVFEGCSDYLINIIYIVQSRFCHMT
jgi:hypothetical protein